MDNWQMSSERQAVSGDTGVAVSIQRIGKQYGSFTALNDIDLDIRDNEFFTLLGPSGCGKTTLLRIIAGFETTSAGTLLLYGEEIETLPPHKRPINTVFQNYSLFPHMNVTENIGFGLQMLGWRADEISSRIVDMIKLVRLEKFAQRKPSQLSGGQQQRVALARAMAPRPKLLLLDEPLSALDLKLRQQMRAELKALQRDTGITFVFVTHDQEEALSMSDRIAVMSAGQIQQVGTPAEIYEQPANRFIADFIGDTNLIDAEVMEMNNDATTVRLTTGCVVSAECADNVSPGCKGLISLRPERLRLQRPDSASSAYQSSQLHGVIVDIVYLGTDRQYRVALGDSLSVNVRAQNTQDDDLSLSAGDRVSVNITSGAARFLVN